MESESWFPEAVDLAEVRGRSAKALAKFQQKFGTLPDQCIRVPGRVNLIGEHIDYCGYGVFPMAIQQDIFLCVGKTASASTNGSTLKLVNTAEQHKDFECPFDQIRSILDSRESGVRPGWHLYFLCGVQGIIDRFSLLGNNGNALLGNNGNGSQSLLVCLDGIIPPCAGLSSSSAVVCSAALAMLIAHNIEMSRADLASLCAKSERYIGTEGGGMDQAIEMLATAGTAQLIEFLPSLHGEKVQLPKKAIFVIANSIAESNKAASNSFNTRVAECRLATWILAKKFNISDDIFGFTQLKNVQLSRNFTYDEMKTFVEKTFHPEPYSAAEIAKLLEVEVDDLAQKPLMNRIPFHSTQFQLYNRAKHVIEEAERVQKFRKACLDGNLEAMGRLMSESHWSLSKLYDCSHPFLDKMVTISEGMSYGARLTGAGWGGCMVALVDQSQLPKYLEALKTQFYSTVHQNVTLDDRHLFVTQPGPGASVYLAKTLL